MTRGNWFTTNVIGKICQKLYVRLDHDFPFATLKSVCVEDQHGRVVFTVPSTCVHKPLPAGWLTSSHVFRGHLELLFGKNQLVKDFRFWQFFRACVSQTRETTRSYVILLLFPACLLSLLVPRLPQADFTFQWLSRGCSSNSRGPWFPNTTLHQVDSVEIIDLIFKADCAVHLWSCSHEDCFQVRFVFERKDKGMVMIMAAVV